MVPSIGVISQFSVSNISDIDLSDSMQPGVLHPILDALQTQEEDEYMLCADAKKVTSGVDKVGGDVDMFAYEDGVTLSTRKQTLQDEMSSILAVKESLKFQLSSASLKRLQEEEKNITD